jgi:hypothetical protein
MGGGRVKLPAYKATYQKISTLFAVVFCGSVSSHGKESVVIAKGDGAK